MSEENLRSLVNLDIAVGIVPLKKLKLKSKFAVDSRYELCEGDSKGSSGGKMNQLRSKVVPNAVI